MSVLIFLAALWNFITNSFGEMSQNVYLVIGREGCCEYSDQAARLYTFLLVPFPLIFLFLLISFPVLFFLRLLFFFFSSSFCLIPFFWLSWFRSTYFFLSSVLPCCLPSLPFPFLPFSSLSFYNLFFSFPHPSKLPSLPPILSFRF